MDIKIKKINFEGNILKVIKATVTEIRGINNHQKYDFDLYQIEARSKKMVLSLKRSGKRSKELFIKQVIANLCNFILYPLR